VAAEACGPRSDCRALCLHRADWATEPTPPSSPIQEAQRRESAALVADALAELEPEDSEVVILRSLHELDWNAIAAKTGRSPDAARMLWARAMQRVGGLLEGKLS